MVIFFTYFFSHKLHLLQRMHMLLKASEMFFPPETNQLSESLRTLATCHVSIATFLSLQKVVFDSLSGDKFKNYALKTKNKSGPLLVA